VAGGVPTTQAARPGLWWARREDAPLPTVPIAVDSCPRCAWSRL